MLVPYRFTRVSHISEGRAGAAIDSRRLWPDLASLCRQSVPSIYRRNAQSPASSDHYRRHGIFAARERSQQSCRHGIMVSEVFIVALAYKNVRLSKAQLASISVNVADISER